VIAGNNAREQRHLVKENTGVSTLPLECQPVDGAAGIGGNQ
jgi:hypothetical protein